MDRKTLQKKSQNEVTGEWSMRSPGELNSLKCRKLGYDINDKNDQNTQTH